MGMHKYNVYIAWEICMSVTSDLLASSIKPILS